MSFSSPKASLSCCSPSTSSFLASLVSIVSIGNSFSFFNPLYWRNFAAGSYLLDSGGQKILDFYYFAYERESRREAFYKTIDWDYTVQEISKHTISASDVSLNNRTFLKLVTNFGGWRDSQYAEKRVFFLLSQGNKMYYFTYPLSVESKADDYKNLLIIIANTEFSTPVYNHENWISCFPFLYDPLTDKSWQADINAEGELVIVQKTEVSLKNQPIDKSTIEASVNYQNPKQLGKALNDFEIKVDSSLRGEYKDAFVIKIRKGIVDDIIQKTPLTIPSVAVLIKFNGSLETLDGKKCYTSAPKSYFASKP